MSNAQTQSRDQAVIAAIHRAFAPARLAAARMGANPPAKKWHHWHQLDTTIGDDFMVEVFYDVDTDERGRHAVDIHEVQVVGDSGSTIELSRKSQARIEELCLADWLANHNH